MNQDREEQGTQQITRRDFLVSSATVAAAALTSGLVIPDNVYAAGNDLLRVGLIGCGGRGTGAADNCVNAAPNVVVTALGDLFKERLDGSRQHLAKMGDKCKVTDERCFVGFDAYQKVIDSGVDLVILATPPGFRPQQLRAAVEAGKHIFTEKPVAVCPAGVRSALESARIAREKGLGIVAGTQRRHESRYLETIRRLHDGAVGKILSAQCYWNQGGLWRHDRKPEYSDVEWQVRNWLYFTWISGDHIVEQHVHNLDVINWVLQAHPVSAYGMGGRQARTDPAYGNIYDHFAVEYEYPNGVRVTSMCRQIEGCADRVSEFVIGTRGVSDPGGWVRGEAAWKFEGANNDPYVQEHKDLIESIRAGRPLNEGQAVAESTLTAIMGRMSAYTGKVVTWDQAMASQLDLMWEKPEFGPREADPVPVPGRTPLV